MSPVATLPLLLSLLPPLAALPQGPEVAPEHPDHLQLPEEYDYQALLEELTDLRRLVIPPVPGERALQFSSWDRRSQAGPDDPEAWYANGDRGQFLRQEEGPDGPEWVLAESEGPGVVTRIWSANPSGELRFYVDGAAEPALAVPFEELCRGDVEPFLAPLCGERSRGWNCYLPLPFQRSLKITATSGDFYYHVNVRLLPEGTRVPSLSRELLDENLRLIRYTCEVLANRRLYPDPWKAHMRAGPIPPGRTLTWQFRGKGTVRALNVLVRNLTELPDVEAALRSLRLRVTADGAESPQVDVPFGDFFGSGPGLQPFTSFPFRVTSAGFFSCFLPMPFRDGLRLEIVNEGREKVVVRLEAGLDQEEWGPLRLHAAWHQEKEMPTRPRRDFRILEADGPGRFVGCALTVLNPTRAWWGEGDEKFYVDGEGFPSTFGTGTEDYFGYAWCCPEPFEGPFHAQARCDGPGNYGYTSVNRFQLADHVPFQRSFRFDLEVWHWQDVEVDYASTAWWYAPATAGHKLPPLPEVAERLPRPVPVLDIWRAPGALEAESLKAWVASGPGQVRKQDMGGFAGGKWSGEQQLWWTGGQPGNELALDIPAPADRDRPYRLKARFTKARDYAVIRVRVEARTVLKDLDLYDPEVVPTEELDLGEVRFTRDSLRVVLEIAGANPEAVPAYMVGVDFFRLEPVAAEESGEDGGGS